MRSISGSRLRHGTETEHDASQQRPDDGEPPAQEGYCRRIAATISFEHVQHLAITHGQTQLAADLLPVSIDSTVAAASLVMLHVARAGLPTPWLGPFHARLAFAGAARSRMAVAMGSGRRSVVRQ